MVYGAVTHPKTFNQTLLHMRLLPMSEMANSACPGNGNPDYVCSAGISFGSGWAAGVAGAGEAGGGEEFFGAGAVDSTFLEACFFLY